VVNNGKRVARIVKVAAITENKARTIVESGITMRAPGLTELRLGQNQDVIDIKEDGGQYVWKRAFTENPYFEQTPRDKELYGAGYVELTSKQKMPFEFLLHPDDLVALANMRNNVDPKSVGHKCSKCGAVQMILKPQYRPRGSYSSLCQCGHKDVITP